MSEYIKREDALDAVLFALVGTGYQSNAIYAIRDVPAADVEEVRHGTWLPIIERSSYLDPPYYDTGKCSSCGYVVDVSEMHFKYCPECGAKMGERRDENEG